METRNITFESDNTVLVGKVFTPPVPNEKNHTVLFIHGWDSRKESGDILLEMLAQEGFICMSFDLRGHGESEGDMHSISKPDFTADATAAYDTLLKQPNVDPDRLIIVGASFGGYLTALLSAHRPARALVMRVPANYPDTSVALDAVANFSGEVLIVEAEKDDVVPSVTVRSYVEAAKPENVTHVIAKDMPHSLTGHEDLQREYASIVTGWLRESTSSV